MKQRNLMVVFLRLNMWQLFIVLLWSPFVQKAGGLATIQFPPTTCPGFTIGMVTDARNVLLTTQPLTLSGLSMGTGTFTAVAFPYTKNFSTMNSASWIIATATANKVIKMVMLTVSVTNNLSAVCSNGAGYVSLPSTVLTSSLTQASVNDAWQTRTTQPVALTATSTGYGVSQLSPVIATVKPSKTPTTILSTWPLMKLKHNSRLEASNEPSINPSKAPTAIQSMWPTLKPTHTSSLEPSNKPSFNPSKAPTALQSMWPTLKPTQTSSLEPSNKPSFNPSKAPTAMQSMWPTLKPTHT